MSYIAAIKEHVNNVFVDSGKVLMGEAECKDIKLKGTYVILKTDHKDFKDKVVSTLYNAGNARCICDYVVISDSVILVCELKSNNFGKMSIQLRNTGRFIKCILEMVKEHGKVKREIPPIKYVCFAKRNQGYKQTSTNKIVGIPWVDSSELYQLPCNSIYHLNQFN